MKKWISLLAVLLAVQIAGAVIMHTSSASYEAFQAEEKLLPELEQHLIELRIEDGTNSVLLEKQTTEWLLPDRDNHPASQQAIEQLVEALGALEKGWPVANSESARGRFRVDTDQFERKLTLVLNDNSETTLYIGSAPEFGKVYMRLTDSNEIYAVKFTISTASVNIDDWVED